MRAGLLARAEEQPVLDVARFAPAADGAEEDGGGVEQQANDGAMAASGVAVDGGGAVAGDGAATRDVTVCGTGIGGGGVAAGGSVAVAGAITEGCEATGNASGAEDDEWSREVVGADGGADGGGFVTAACGVEQVRVFTAAGCAKPCAPVRLPSSSCSYVRVSALLP